MSQPKTSFLQQRNRVIPSRHTENTESRPSGLGTDRRATVAQFSIQQSGLPDPKRTPFDSLGKSPNEGSTQDSYRPYSPLSQLSFFVSPTESRFHQSGQNVPSQGLPAAIPGRDSFGQAARVAIPGMNFRRVPKPVTPLINDRTFVAEQSCLPPTFSASRQLLHGSPDKLLLSQVPFPELTKSMLSNQWNDFEKRGLQSLSIPERMQLPGSHSLQNFGKGMFGQLPLVSNRQFARRNATNVVSGSPPRVKRPDEYDPSKYVFEPVRGLTIQTNRPRSGTIPPLPGGGHTGVMGSNGLGGKVAETDKAIKELTTAIKALTEEMKKPRPKAGTNITGDRQRNQLPSVGFGR